MSASGGAAWLDNPDANLTRICVVVSQKLLQADEHRLIHRKLRTNKINTMKVVTAEESFF